MRGERSRWSVPYRVLGWVGRPVVAVPFIAIAVTAPWVGPIDAGDGTTATAQHQDTEVDEGSADELVVGLQPGKDPLTVSAADRVREKQHPTGERYGIDVSWPQCGGPLPKVAIDYVVVGLTDGQAMSENPCLEEQVRWAKKQKATLSYYVIPNSPSAETLAAAEERPACAAEESECLHYNAGVVQAEHALAVAESVKAPNAEPRSWWLDVEESHHDTLWGENYGQNAAVLRGWITTLGAAGYPVGIYSTNGYWDMITDDLNTNLPEWVAVGESGMDAAREACTEPFSDGPVVMTQWLTGPLDGNLVCSDQQSLAGEMLGPWVREKTAGVPELLTIPVPHPELELEPEPQEDEQKAEKKQKAKGKQKAKNGESAGKDAAAPDADEDVKPAEPQAKPDPKPVAMPEPQPKPTPKPQPTPEPQPSPTPAPKPQPKPTPTPAPTPTPTPTPTATQPRTEARAPSPSPTPTVALAELPIDVS